MKALAGAWVAVIAVLFVSFAWYQNSPGKRSSVPLILPAAVGTSTTVEPTLLFFVHPGCPCTKASFYELERLLARVNHPIRAVAVVTGYPNVDTIVQGGAVQELLDSELFTVMHVPEETVVSVFGATTSGFCVLYNSNGSLVFEGGVTPSRGHTGPNNGVAALEDFLIPETEPATHTNIRHNEVYGCEL